MSFICPTCFDMYCLNIFCYEAEVVDVPFAFSIQFRIFFIIVIILFFDSDFVYYIVY